MGTARGPVKVSVVGSGSVVRVKTEGNVQRGGGRRGRISGFSQASRRRMLEKFAGMDKRNFHHSLMGDMTYGRVMLDGGQVDRDVEELHRRILRRYGGTWLTWKKEWQKRGSLHIHFLLGGPKFIGMDWLQEAWGSIIGQWVPFTRIERSRSYKGAMAYLSKYMAKVDDEQHGGPGGGAASAAARSGSPPVGSTDVTYSRKRVWGLKGRKYVIEAVVVFAHGETTPEKLQQARVKARAIWNGVGWLGGWMLYVGDGAFEAQTVSMILGLCAEVGHSDEDEAAWWRLEVDRHREELALDAAMRPEWVRGAA